MGTESGRETVLVYTTRYCPYCRAAKELLRSKNVAFREIDVTDDGGMREKLVQMTGGRETVPQIFIGGRPIGGYTELVQYLGRRPAAS